MKKAKDRADAEIQSEEDLFDFALKLRARLQQLGSSIVRRKEIEIAFEREERAGWAQARRLNSRESSLMRNRETRASHIQLRREELQIGKELDSEEFWNDGIKASGYQFDPLQQMKKGVFGTRRMIEEVLQMPFVVHASSFTAQKAFLAEERALLSAGVEVEEASERAHRREGQGKLPTHTLNIQDFLNSEPYNEALEFERDPTDPFNFYGLGGSGGGSGEGRKLRRGISSVGTARSSYVGLRWRQDPVTGRAMRYPMGSGVGGRVCWDDLTLEKIPGRQRRFLGAIMRKWYGGPILLSRYILEAVGLT